MKRGTFRRKTYPEVLEARQATQARQRERAQANLAISASVPRRKSSLANASPTGSLASQGLKGRQRAMRKWKPGGKVDQWAEARKWLKVEFEIRGIVTCQLKYRGCWRDNALSFCHPAKRDRLTPGEIYVVALGCVPCHNILEIKPADEMRTIVERLFAATGIQRPLEP